MRVLVACEESQEVCKAFREKGHEAFSCDIQDCSGGHPEWHIKGDVLPLLNGNCTFMTADTHTHTQNGRWDLIIAHPPCTYLTVSGNRYFVAEKYGKKAEDRWRNRVLAAVFFMRFVGAECERIAVENPIGIMSAAYTKPSQIIQPYQFGNPVRKATCLWLKGLPNLKPTKVVEPQIISVDGGTYSGPAYYVTDENGKILSWNDPRTAKARSKTYTGIAKAMADQWGDEVVAPLEESQLTFWGSK